MRLPRLGLLALALSWSALQAGAVEQVGQVVCSECWYEADRAKVAYGTPADLDCAKRCADKGVGASLAIRHDGHFDLLPLEGGPTPAAQGWLELIGRFVRVSGSSVAGDGPTSLRVASVALLDENPWKELAGAADEPARLEWKDLGGHAQSVEALHGRFVVLNFWATWCEPCKEEMPDLVRLQNDYGMYGVQVLGAAADDDDDRARVEKFARKLDINFPVLLGATTAQMETLDLGIALPATAVLDRHGGVVHRVRGVVERHELERVLDALIAGEKPPGSLGRRAHLRGRPTTDEHAGTHASLVPS